MNWDKLKSFYEIAISRSISKASTKLNISQSALSRQIQDLEYDLKTPLFIRHQKGVRLTEQGENLFIRGVNHVEPNPTVVLTVSFPTGLVFLSNSFFSKLEIDKFI